MTAEEFKAQGNKAFTQGDYKSAIEHFTQAIQLAPDNHVLYSNRSACYASLRDYKLAIQDAEKTVSLKPDWSKGYSRMGAALHGAGDYEKAADAYRKGLQVEPTNASLKKGLDDVERALESDAVSGLGNIFGPDMYAKMATNPKLSPFLAQPDVMSMLQDCQGDPKNMSKYMQDPRMMQIMLGLMGLDGAMATNPDELAKAKEEANENLERREREEQAQQKAQYTKPMEQDPPEPEQETEVDEIKLKREKSDKEKALGNDFYKKREFDTALKHYNAAFELDETNVAVLTNKAAVLFEMQNYEACIECCEKAVEIGRDTRADFKLIGRALARIGNSYFKLDKLEEAIRYYNKSLTEHRTPDILNKLRETEQLKEKKEKEAYIDPKLSDEEREKGNVFFKSNQFPEAVKCYTEAIKRNPSDPKNYSNRAACYTKLMALPEAERDCDEAIKLDEFFVKAYIRKAAVQFSKKEFTKCTETCNLGISKDKEGKHTAELQGQIQKAYFALGQQHQGESAEETRKRAMNDPEVQKILGDPVMQSILKQMQEDPSAIREHMKNPIISAKMQVLINSGIVSMR